MDAFIGGLRPAVAGFLLAGLTACGTGPPAPSASAPPPDYSLLAVCEPFPPDVRTDQEPIAGLVLPDGAVVTSVTTTGPLTEVDGFIALTPLEVRDHYGALENVDLLLLEDEGFEAETLISDGAYRMYLRARVVCATGSKFDATVGPDAAEGPTVPSDRPATRPGGTPGG